MKRSSQVALLLMGVTAVGAAGYALMPRNDCGAQRAPAPRCPRAQSPGDPCSVRPLVVLRVERRWVVIALRRPRRSSSTNSSSERSSSGSRVERIARRLRLDRRRSLLPAADALHAAHRLRRTRRLARDRREGRLRVSHHRRRALLGRARLLRASRSKEIERDIEAPTAELDGDVPRARRPRDRRRTHPAPASHSGAVLDLRSRRAGSAATRASTAGSTCATTGRGRRSSWNTTPTRRPRCSRPRCSSGRGSNRRSSGRSFPQAPTSTIRCTSA